MKELKPLNVVSLFDTTKQQRFQFVESLVNTLEEGEADPLKVHSIIKSMEDVVKNITSNEKYKNILLESAEKNGKKFQMFNADFSIKEVGVKYDYANCNDTELNELQEQLDELTEKVKARQKFLQTISISGLDIITKDGEAIKVYPPAKSSTTSVTVTLK